jgi:hypothetical protein
MNLRHIAGAVALAAVLGAGMVADTTPAQAQSNAPPLQLQTRGERGSARNLLHVRRKLEALIDQLQRDQHDYGGYRVQAIQALTQARQDIRMALQYDASHPGR